MYQGHELELKAYELFSGLQKYKKETEAEPTDAQFQEIYLKFCAIEFQRLKTGNELCMLKDSFSEKVRNLFPIKTGFHPFWLEVEKFNAVKNSVPPSQNISEKKYAELIYEYVTKHTLISLKEASMLIKHDYSLESVSPFMEKACHEALKRNDLDFFKKVGDVLQKRQKSIDDILVSVPKLRFFLMAHWVKEINGVPPLYSLSISKLLEVCKRHLGVGGLTFDSIEKSRQRIGLLTFRTPDKTSKVKGVGRRKREPLPSQYRIVPVKVKKSGSIDFGPNWIMHRPSSK